MKAIVLLIEYGARNAFFSCASQCRAAVEFSRIMAGPRRKKKTQLNVFFPLGCQPGGGRERLAAHHVPFGKRAGKQCCGRSSRPARPWPPPSLILYRPNGVRCPTVVFHHKGWCRTGCRTGVRQMSDDVKQMRFHHKRACRTGCRTDVGQLSDTVRQIAISPKRMVSDRASDRCPTIVQQHPAIAISPSRGVSDFLSTARPSNDL